MIFRSRALFVAFTVLCLAGLIYQWISGNKVPVRPRLTGEEIRLDVQHVKRNCRCADWKVVRPEKNGGFIYIEPAGEKLRLTPADMARTDSGWMLRLRGQFDQEERIPDSLLKETDSSAEKARVFKYTSAEVVKSE